jgi:DNA-binding MarR family transcriptional regulator
MPETDPHEIWRALLSLVHEKHDRRKEACEALDLSFVRIKALRRIAVSPMTLRDLAAALQTDPPYTTLVVDDLERRGLVRREPHPTDRRAKLAVATDQGQAEAARAEAIITRPPAQMFELTADELSALSAITEKLTGDATSRTGPR